MNQRGSHPFGSIYQIPYSLHIEQPCSAFVTLGTVDSRVSGTIYDKPGM